MIEPIMMYKAEKYAVYLKAMFLGILNPVTSAVHKMTSL